MRSPALVCDNLDTHGVLRACAQFAVLLVNQTCDKQKINFQSSLFGCIKCCRALLVQHNVYSNNRDLLQPGSFKQSKAVQQTKSTQQD